jgi:hypothetical protein
LGMFTGFAHSFLGWVEATTPVGLPGLGTCDVGGQRHVH